MKRLSFFIAIILTLEARAPEAGVLRVPEEYPSILTAIDAASPGDSVLVGPGTWTHRATRVVHLGDVDQTITSCGFLKAPLAVIGTAGPEATIVDAGETGPGFVDTFLLANDPVGTVVLEGMTITGAGNNAAGVIGVDSERIVIKSCKVNWNNVGQFGTAVQGDGCDLVILDSEVSFNVAGQIAGIVVREANIEVRRTRIEGNKETGLAAGGTFPAPTVIITDCTFVGNRGNVWGGGAYVGTSVPVTIERNLFLANVATAISPLGGGLRLGSAGGSIRFNTFAYDSSEQSGGGMSLAEAVGSLSITHNTFIGCHAPTGAAAVSVSTNSLPFEFGNNIISLSTGGSAVRNLSGQMLQGGCNDYWQNYGGDYGVGWQPQPFDFFLDPEFCDLDALDLTVSDESPCAPEGNPVCGQVGAWGVGCGTISVESESWGAIKEMYRE